MARLAVIGNISHDRIVKPDTSYTALGGAALHISWAAARAGLPTAPVAVIGDDLSSFALSKSAPTGLDSSAVVRISGPSASFVLIYDNSGELIDVRADYGVATNLTEHALRRIEAGTDDVYHVCCRTPLDIAPVLTALVDRGATFSLDFIASSAPDLLRAAASALPRSRLVFVNSAEYRWLSTTVSVESLPAVVVSDGARPARLLRYGDLVASAHPSRVAAVRITGAGDTLTGVFLAGLDAGHADATVLRHAVDAATAHTVDQRFPLS